jgi:hypothetical protein
MPAPLLTLFSATALLLLGACQKSIDYAGDGRLIDHGPAAADNRYVIEAGPVDLSRQGTVSFTMTGIPRDYFVIGLQLSGRPARAADGTVLTPANVSIELIREDFGMVALIAGPLRDWTWSGPDSGSTFAYQRQASRSYFDAFPEAHYRLSVTVNIPDPNIHDGSLLVMKTGGWK